MQPFRHRQLCLISTVFLSGMLFFAFSPSVARGPVLGVLTVAAVFSFRIPVAFRRIVRLGLAALLVSSLLCFFFLDLPLRLVSLRATESADCTSVVCEIVDDDAGLYGVSSVRIDGKQIPARLVLRVSFDELLTVGDEVSLTVSLRSFTVWESDSYRSHGYSGILTALGEATVLSHRNTPLSFLSSFSGILISRLASCADGQNSALLTAILLGETDALGGVTSLLFRRLGISHLLAISGMHLVTLSALMLFLLRRLRVPRVPTGIISMIFVFLYAALSGFSPSVLRAMIMAIVFESAYFFRRKSDTMSSLFFSGTLLLLFQPFLVFRLSFWLSFTATLGVLLSISAQNLSVFLKCPAFLRKYLLTPVLITVFASLFTLPIVCLFFGEFSLLTIPSNLLLGIPVQILLILAFFALIFGPLPFVRTVCNAYTSLLLRVVRLIAGARYAVLDFGHPVLFATVVLLIGVLLLLFLLPKAKRKAVSVTASACILLLFTSVLLFALPKSRGESLLCLSSGENEQILLSSGSHRFAVDCSSGTDTARTQLNREFADDRITELDGLLLTHYHMGQAEALASFYKSVYIRRIYLPSPTLPEEVAVFRNICEQLGTSGIPYQVVSGNEKICYSSYIIRVSDRISADADSDPLFTLSVEFGAERFGYVSEGSLPLILTDDNGFPSDTATAVMLGAHGDPPLLPVSVSFSGSTETVIVCGEYHNTCTLTVSPSAKTVRNPLTFRIRYE